MNIAMRIGRWIAAALLLLALTIYFVRAFASLYKPDLGPEYRVEFEHEFDASQEARTDWAAYVALEERLAQELVERISAEERPDSFVDRYSDESVTNPGNYDGNWNRSYVMRAASPRGVAVLVHGLTDSPYSMLATAEALVAAGYNVIAPRMPGHGFAVGGMLQARWEDWTAAVRIAIRHAMKQEGADQTLLLVGYSNGGLMAIDYALRCEKYEGMACPNALILISPAIAVSPLAMFTNLHTAISWTSLFEKFKWESVLPEVDPFKFTSFPKRAAWEIYKILRRTHKELEQPGEVAKLPPILTFQSAVDNTVSASAIVTLLYSRLPKNRSELVVYDVNSSSTLLTLMKGEHAGVENYFKPLAPLNFGVTVLQNHDPGSVAVDALTLAPGEVTPSLAPTGMSWPAAIFSLAHIALPFRPDDAVYGDGSGLLSQDNRISFGALAPRGERGVMRLNAEYFLRMRYNPFFGFQQEHMIEWLDTIEQPAVMETTYDD
jgi:alpha-beta hydrolase superfamily lysophospholipase